MKCKKCKEECEHISSGMPGGWEYWYCTNWSCELGAPNNVPQHPSDRNYNTLERRLDAHMRSPGPTVAKRKQAAKVVSNRSLRTPIPKKDRVKK